MPLSEGDIRVILGLLADDDERIASWMRDKLHRMGEEAVWAVLSAAPVDSAANKEASRVLRRLKAPSVEDRLRALPASPKGDLDLEEGVYAVARLGYPDLDPSIPRARLDHMASELSPGVAPDDHPLRAVRTLNDFLFVRERFRGRPDYERSPDPDDSYLHRVLDRKTGLPIALSVVYILLARRLDLPIVGVNMPGHFIVRYACPEGGKGRSRKPVHQPFYIDPFRAGVILTANECRSLIGRPGDASALPDATNRAILVRTLANLVRTYAALGDRPRAQSARRLIDVVRSGGRD